MIEMGKISMDVVTWSWGYIAQQAVMFGLWFLFLRIVYGEFRKLTHKSLPQAPRCSYIRSAPPHFGNHSRFLELIPASLLLPIVTKTTADIMMAAAMASLSPRTSPARSHPKKTATRGVT